MRPLRYSINVSLDGCVDHTAGNPDEETHRHAAKTIADADAIILGRTTYELMEFWRTAQDLPPWMRPFQEAINAAKKYLVSSTREPDGWNTEALTGDPVRRSGGSRSSRAARCTSAASSYPSRWPMRGSSTSTSSSSSRRSWVTGPGSLRVSLSRST